MSQDNLCVMAFYESKRSMCHSVQGVSASNESKRQSVQRVKLIKAFYEPEYSNVICIKESKRQRAHCGINADNWL